MNQLAEVLEEIEDVKLALRNGRGYLCMQGEQLQQYLSQLKEKENILVRLHNNTEGQVANGANIHSKANDDKASGGYRAEYIAPAKPPPTPIDPSAPPVQFAKDDINGILAHLRDQEGNPLEAARGLRAFASFAYNGAAKVGACPEALSQVKRLTELYPEDEALQLAAIKGFKNSAFVPAIARERLTDKKVFSVIVRAAARNESSQVAAQANETVARIVAAWGADVGPVLRSLIEAVTLSDEDAIKLVAKILAQLTNDHWDASRYLQNEHVTVDNVANELVASMEAFEDEPIGTVRFLELLNQLCQPSVKQQVALTTAGVIQKIAKSMDRHIKDKFVQRAGIDAFGSIIGSSWDGLHRFAEADGILKIEAAMRAHPEDELLQMKGIKALASVNWPEEFRQKAKYDPGRAVGLTKAAMKSHCENGELQVDCLEALAHYLDQNCKEEVQANDGEGLVKAMMTKHENIENMQKWGRKVLDGLGLKN